MFKNKNILITGGAGSVGLELAKRLVKDAKVVRLLDNNENGLFKAEQIFKERENVRYLLGDIRYKDRLKRAVEDIDIVFHCAALKHVWSCEYNPFEAVRINIDGLQNAIEVAMDAEVEKFIFTSSDKAANPSNVMGTTKLVGEKLVTAASYYKGSRKTVFSSIRFGNVLGSSGSVIPLFKEQILSGGPVTLTHRDMTRFIITMSQAIDLVCKATKLAHGGEVFILKMDAIKVKDLAEVMIQELASGKNIEIKEEGIKPGEKLYEELMTKEEVPRALETEDMFIILPQLIELLHINRDSYSNAKKVENKIGYTSNDNDFLSKEKIKGILKKEGLL